MDYSHVIIERLLQLHPKEIDLSLGRLQRLLDLLDNPETKLPPVIHVAGTNGKGSTVAFMRAILEADNKRVHTYTSPHLVSYHERFRMAGPAGNPAASAFVEEDVLADALSQCERINDGAPITVFEITTAAGLLLFSRHPADVLLLEVGLGGRLDATNVVDRPAVTVITPVSIDHTQFLGDTIEEIAFEKAGILKQGVPAIIARQTDAASRVIERQAARVGAPLVMSGEAWHAWEEHGRLVYQDMQGGGGLLDLPLPRLPGRHQIENAGTAIAAIRALGQLAPSDEAIEAGMSSVEWPARMQRLQDAPLVEWAPPGAELWLDGSHNPGGGAVLAEVLADMEDRAPRPLIVICGMLSNKDAVGYLEHFEGLAAHLIAVPIPGEQNTAQPEDLAEVARQIGMSAHAATSVREALAAVPAVLPFADAPPRILFCGSLYLAGDILRTIRDAAA
ncbi:MAG: folylpolyglutamate synthase/dihydrofolate synthase family protein [Pseudomonadota bacterium]